MAGYYLNPVLRNPLRKLYITGEHYKARNRAQRLRAFLWHRKRFQKKRHGKILKKLSPKPAQRGLYTVGKVLRRFTANVP